MQTRTHLSELCLNNVRDTFVDEPTATGSLERRRSSGQGAARLGEKIRQANCQHGKLQTTARSGGAKKSEDVKVNKLNLTPFLSIGIRLLGD